MTGEPHHPELDSEALKAFEIRLPATIIQHIDQILTEENELYVYADNGNVHFISEILGIDTSDTGQAGIWIAKPFDKSIVKGIDSNAGFVVVSFPAGIKLQFSGKGLTMGTYSGVKAIFLPMPDCVYRMQRRNHFRVLADEEMMVHLKVSDQGFEGDFELVDLSTAGCGVSIEGSFNHYVIGQQYKNCELIMPDGLSSIPVVLTVRNVQTNPEDSMHVCLGCKMEIASQEDENTLQRFLLAAERRQRARQVSFSK